MSNNAVGQLYKSIIEEVISTSRVDFEEGGVDDQVLDLLRQGWQNKLSHIKVATFPWDPKPEPAPTPEARPTPPPPPPPAPAAAPPPQVYPQAHLSPSIPAPGGLSLPTTSAAGPNGASIKTEPDTGSGSSVDGATIKQEPYPDVARERAKVLLNRSFGNRAVNSVNALSSGPAIHGRGPVAPKIEGQSSHTPHPAMPVPPQQLQQTPAASPPQGQRSAGSNQASVKQSQTDGAADEGGEFEGVLMERDDLGNLKELGTVEIDRWIHRQVAARAKSIEGGGLMLPLSEVGSRVPVPSHVSQRSAGIARFDGVEDEDAINSDLDDPEEERDEDAVDDEGLGHIMLCMYDKVQRVKNKWKCTLKDGVLTVNGKEYVFHKATGEYEW